MDSLLKAHIWRSAITVRAYDDDAIGMFEIPNSVAQEFGG